MSKQPSVFFAALFRGPAARHFEPVLTASKLVKKPTSLGWPAGNRHQSLSDLMPHPIDLRRLLQVGAGVDCAPVVLHLNRIESTGRVAPFHWALKPEKNPELERLLDAIRLSLVQHGFDKGSRNSPHITLSYRAPSALSQPVLFEPIEWRIDQFQLLRSTGHGPTYHYEELGSWPLAGEPELSQLPLI
ncbi:MAG: 2'-5' RNA ligase family protein [Stagnimonas sp.]|nr:2'-5' RNA ligase family protein [Stagnimonas sp.]